MADLNKPDFFRRMDESEDEEFYRSPRRVVHIDDGAIATIGEIYASRIKAGSEILDLMSSWRSHLPADLRPARVTGLGLNADEMRDNPVLTEVVVHNVNREPRMPFPDQSFDAVVMTVSVQYLTRPIETFAGVGRVLRPGGPLIVTFSNRMFPTKAVALWQASTNEQRVAIVTSYFAQSSTFERIEAIDRSRRDGEPSDPVWAVLGYRER
jgi:SAM-dependent methyltransferase